MKCKDIQKNIDSYLTEDMSEEEIKKMDSHLQTCSKCREFKDSLDSAWSALDLWEDKDPPCYLKTNILHTIRRDEQKRKHTFILRHTLSAAAMVFLVFTLVFSFIDLRDSSQNDNVIIESSSHEEIIRQEHKTDEKEFLIELSHDEREFFEQVEVLSNFEFLYLMESQEKQLPES